MKTYTARAADIQREWLVVDAQGKTLGRLATQVAAVLKGKHKPMFTPSMDTGDHVIVINAAKVALTGRKAQDKKYFHHTMYPGGATWTTIQEMMAKHPERVVQKAVQGMLPHTKLGRAMVKKLKVYAGAEHPHEAQQPAEWTPGRKGTRN
jgi:large subunit ribosomal protein L13